MTGKRKREEGESDEDEQQERGQERVTVKRPRTTSNKEAESSHTNVEETDKNDAEDRDEPTGHGQGPDSKPVQAAPKKSKKRKARNVTASGPWKAKPTIIKLAPNRPYPNVPTSSSATGPKSKRKEGNNKICVTRRTPLAAYLSQCRNVFIKEGYKELYLAAMGAAIPHAVMLATSLPEILPYPPEEITTSVTTGTVTVLDELVPEDEDDEGGTQSRSKASIEIIIRWAPNNGIDVDNVAFGVGIDVDSDEFSD